MVEYDIGDFYKASTIGVIARGMSIEKLDKYQKFKYCFLVGKQVESMKKLNYCLSGKKIVSIMPKKYMSINKEHCDILNIKDVQVIYKSLNGKVQKNIDKNPWLNYHFFPKEFKNKIVPGRGDTGGFAINFAACFDPKVIDIIGVDFYSTRYFCEENPKSFLLRDKQEDLKKYFYKVCKKFPHIKFDIYTYYRGLKSKNNITVFNINPSRISM